MTVYLGTVMSFGFNYAPKGWATCSGQLLAVSTNQALFALLGTTYGGNGQQTFGLPDLQGRAIVGWGTDTTGRSWTLGEMAGTGTTTLLMPNLPSHTHTTSTAINLPAYSDGGNSTNPTGRNFAVSPGSNIYTKNKASNALKPFQENLVVGISGGSTAFNNMSPYQVVNYSIALQGIFPSRD